MGLGKRLRQRRDQLGMTQEELSRASGVAQATISAIETRDSKRSEYAAALAAALGTTVEALSSEIDAPPKGFVARAMAEHAANTAVGPELSKRVPPISWVQAGTWSSVVDNLAPGDAEEWIETSVPVHQHTYALRVRGDSMTNPAGAPSFPDGTVIIVEPDAISTLEQMVGSYVIARQNGDEECTFKRLVRDAGAYYLKPLNPQYPLLRLAEDAVICGVVRAVEMRFF